MSSPNTFVLGGLVLDQDSGVDESTHVVTSSVGWDDASAVRSSLDVRAQQDGAWDATGFLGPRVITINGNISEATPQAASAFRDQLVALSPQQPLTLQVSNQSVGVRSATVRVTVGAVITWRTTTSFDYVIVVTAPDPLKYGPAVFSSVGLTGVVGSGLAYPLAYPRNYGVPAGQTPGSLALPNSGKAAYWPRLRIDGPVPNPVVTLNETGDQIRFGGTVAAGQWLDIDLASRRVLLNGSVSVRSKVTSSGSWLAVPPGGGSISWAADAADPAALLSVWSYQGAWS
jgi:hypothetical protein